MSSPRSSVSVRGAADVVSTRRALLALLADGVLVIIFVLIGRSSHDEGVTLAGTATTAWPFLAGLALGWLGLRAWRTPLAIRWSGLLIWASTVIVGIALRALSDQGVQVSFVIVTAIVLGVFLLGWRLIARAVIRTRAKSLR